MPITAVRAAAGAAIALLAPVLMAWPSLAAAQQAGRAGQVQSETEQALQRDGDRGARRSRPAPVRVDLPERREGLSPATARVAVRRFIVEGATAVPAAELEALLVPLTGPALAFEDLARAAEIVTEAYNRRGLLAQAFLPRQALRDAQVRIEVRERRVAAIEEQRSAGVRLQPGLAARAVRRELREGEVVDLRALERAMRALGDLPGLQVATALSEDAALGTVLRVELDEGPRLSGQVGLGNGGSHALGHVLADARLDVTDALGRGEQFSLTLLGTGRPLRYGQLGMQWPLLPGGLVLEAGASALSYRDRTAPDADSADAGRSRSQSIGLVHTPWRSAETTLTLHAGGEQRTLRDAAGASPRDVWRAQLALQLEHNAAQRSLELRLEAQTGVAHLLAAADRAIDAGDATTPGAGVDGRFSKLVYRLGWRQYGDGAWSGVMSLRGQHALQRNLEDSEQLAAGGPGAVRAYPGGEASSDSLDLLSLEARRPLGAAGGAWQFAAFVDAAWAQRRHRPGVTLGDNPDGPVPNRYRLAGAGVGLSHARPSGFQFSLSVAHPLGDNPGRSVGGLNSDGHRDGWRGWCQMTWQL